MSDKQKNYIASALVLIVALIAGYFGIQLPVQPEIPEPLDIADIEALVDEKIPEPFDTTSIESLIDYRINIAMDAGAASFAVPTSGEGYTNFTNLGLSGDLSVGDDASIVGGIDVAGTSIFTGAMTAVNMTVSGAVDFDSTLNVDGASDLRGNVSSSTGSLTVTDNALITGTLTVSGTSNFVGDVSSTTGAFTVADNLNVTGFVQIALNTENIMLPSVITCTLAFGTATGSCATIADGEIWFVHKLFVRTTTDFDCTGNDCTLTIGDDLDVDGFITAVDAELQAAFTEATGFAAGWFGIENGSQGAYTLDDGGPFVYAPSGADQTIDYVIGGTNPAAGDATVYIIYTRVL